MTFSIRTVLLGGFCGLLALSLTAVILTGLLGALGNTLSLMARESTQMVDQAELRLTEELRPIEYQAAYLAAQFEAGRIRFSDPNRLSVVLESSMAALPDLAGMLMIDVEGLGYRFLSDRHNGTLPVVRIGNYHDFPGIVEALEVARTSNGSVWRRPVWVPEIAQTVINLHTPIHFNGQFVGLLIQGKAIADLSAHLRNLQNVPGKVPFLLYGEDRVLAHPGLAELALDVTSEEPLPDLATFQDGILAAFPVLEEVILENFADSDGFRMGRTEFSGEDYLFSYRRVEGLATDRSIIVGLYVNESIYDVFRDRVRWILAVGGGVFILSILVALTLARATSRPIQALAAASEQVASGALKTIPALPRSRMKELDEAGIAFGAMVKGLMERERILELFGRVVPEKIAERMLTSPQDLAPQKVEATVLFCDLVDFTHMTEKLGPDRVVAMLNEYFTDMVDIIHAHGGIVTQFQGDAILAVFNLPLRDPGHAAKAIACGAEMRHRLSLSRYAEQRLFSRIGIATGPLIAANVGAASRMNYTVHGDTVNLAARLEDLNKQLHTDILIHEATAYQAVGLALRDLGPHEIRGRANPVRLYTLEIPEPEGTGS